MSSDPAADSRIQQLLEELLESGRAPDDVCEEPDLLPELRRRWEQLRRVAVEVEAIFPSSSGDGSARPAPDAPAELPNIPGYDVHSLLGRGGMGVVYRARHRKLDRDVAIKMVLAGRYAGPDERSRFSREAQAVAALRSPNVVEIHDVGEFDGAPYFTMELLEGGSLARALGGAPQPPRHAASTVATLAVAVQVAHDAGVVHRDLKPSNILLTRDGVLKIADFGLARRLENDAELTLSGARLGTPSYMAPEQAMGRSSEVGTAADVYALGALLYEMVTGRPPFRGATPAETQRQVLEEEPTPPSKRNPAVPRDLETICLKCLSKDPARRYATAAALAEDLHRFLRGESVLARPAGLLERIGKWVRRRPAHATIAAGSVLAAVSLAGAGLWWGLQRAAIERSAEDDLRELARMTAASNWPEARVAWARATARLAGDGSAELRAKLDQAARELAFVERLDAIRMARIAVVHGEAERARKRAQDDAAFESAFRDVGLGDVFGDADQIAARIRSSGIRAELISALDVWAPCAIADVRRRDGIIDVARRADARRTEWRDRARDPATWNDAKALAELIGSAPIGEESVVLLHDLAERVVVAGGDAVPFLTKIQEEHPADFWSNFTLGLVLADADPKDAIRYFQAAVAIRPDAPVPRGNLASALGASGRIDEAIVHLRRAILLDPAQAAPHSNLGLCFATRGQHEEALEHFREAVRLDPGSPKYRSNLGRSLVETGRVNEAIDQLREAVRIAPGFGTARYRLGYSLHAAGSVEEAIPQLKRAIELQPQDSGPHECLGHVLDSLGRSQEAVACYREAVRLRPGFAPPREALIEALLGVGRFEEARIEARRYFESLPPGDARSEAAQAILRRCEDVYALEADVDAILAGTRRPDDAFECRRFADLFRGKGDNGRAARYFADAFASSAAAPAVSGDRRKLDAARCAVLAALSEDESETDARDEEERKGWRVRALSWLGDELAALEVELKEVAPRSRISVLQKLAAWKADPAFAGVRDVGAIGSLPDDEQGPWRALWRKVDEVSTRARGVR